MTERPVVRHVLPARLGEPRFDSPLRLDVAAGKGAGTVRARNRPDPVHGGR